MTELPALHHGADIRSITERVNVLIADLNSGRVESLAQALEDIEQLQTDVTALQGDVSTLQSDLAALDARVTALEDLHDSDAVTTLGSPVNLNNTTLFFSGPNTGALPAGKYLLIGSAHLYDTSAAATFNARIHNGTSSVASNGGVGVTAANFLVDSQVFAIVSHVSATTYTLQAQDVSQASGILQSGSSITAVRLQ